MMPARALREATIDDVQVRTYVVPTDLPEADGTLSWDATTVVVVLASAGDVVGLGYTYGPAACATLVQEMLADTVRGGDALAVRPAWEAMVRAVRNAGRPGIASLAISAVDLALWDLKARLLGVPLHRLLGGGEGQVPVYGSGGFTSYDDAQLAEQLEGYLALGLRQVKIKIGQDRGTAEDRDCERVRLARRVIGADRGLFVDANGAYAPSQAVRVMGRLDAEQVAWFEEPVSSDDVDGLRFVRERVVADVAAGEYVHDLAGALRLCEARCLDCLQLDVTRCGGITGWQAAAALAAAYQLPVSAHCAPAASLAPATATPHLRHLEWFHDHVRIERLLFDGVADPRDGRLSLPEGAGNGLRLREHGTEGLRVA